MLILAVAAGLLISFSMPLTYYWLSSKELERTSSLRARLISETVAEAVRDNESLWYYDVPRFLEISRRLPREEKVVAIRILDVNHKTVFEDVRPGRELATFTTEAPILFNSRTFGYLVLEESKFDMVMTSALVLLGFALVGILLGLSIFWFPVHMVNSAEALVKSFVGELRQSRDELQEAAIRDGKTHLFNATYLVERLNAAVTEAEQTGLPMQIAMLDIDYFKKFNDANGHLAGDVLLEELSRIMAGNIRATDILGRFGGEEFMVIFPRTLAKTAETVMTRLQAAIADHAFPGAEVLPGGKLTVSIGLASLTAGMTATELINAADLAMYMAKEAGRNQISLFSGGDYYIEGKKTIYFSDLSFQHRSFQDLMLMLEGEGGNKPYSATVSSLISYLKTLDSRESDTAQHSFLVNRIAMAIGRSMQLPEKDLLQLNWGTLLHDLGKLGISDAILLKPAALTEEEYATIRRHPQVGFDLIRDNEYLTSAGKIVLLHHERWDGAGYPHRLSGLQIPLLARICSVADTVAAMAVDRPYRKGMALERILAEIRGQAGLQFDPDVVKAFVSLPEKQKLIYVDWE